MQIGGQPIIQRRMQRPQMRRLNIKQQSTIRREYKLLLQPEPRIQRGDQPIIIRRPGTAGTINSEHAHPYASPLRNPRKQAWADTDGNRGLKPPIIPRFAWFGLSHPRTVTPIWVCCLVSWPTVLVVPLIPCRYEPLFQYRCILLLMGLFLSHDPSPLVCFSCVVFFFFGLLFRFLVLHFRFRVCVFMVVWVGLWLRLRVFGFACS